MGINTLSKTSKKPNLKTLVVSECVYESTHFRFLRTIDRSSSRSYILKALTSTATTSINMLHCEFNIVSDVSHTNVIKYIDIIPYMHSVAIIQQDNGTQPIQFLLDKLPKKLNDKLRIIKNLINGLEHIHSLGIIHCGINSRSILCNSNFSIVQYTDFSNSIKYNGSLINSINITNFDDNHFYYIAPEQTGKTSYNISFQTDYYSLGVLIYEILTGSKPFQDQNIQDIIYAHVTVRPKPPIELCTDIPEYLSNAIMKLIEKMPDNRYESLKLLEKNLCPPIMDLQLNTQINHGLQINYTNFNKKVFIGRKSEIQQLTKKVTELLNGESPVCFISGESGVGKSSLIDHYFSLMSQDVKILSAKYNQLNQGNAYGPLMEILHKVTTIILSEDSIQLEKWKLKILNEFEDELNYLLELIPELKSIIEINSYSHETLMGPIEAKNKFLLFYAKYLNLFTDVYPTVIFLDDLQWIDLSSINLIEYILNYQIKKAFLLFTYRQDEIVNDHILKRLIYNYGETNTLQLSGISLKESSDLISSLLDTNLIPPLDIVQIIHNKTGGNPFYTKFLLKKLYSTDGITKNLDGSINFNLLMLNQIVMSENVPIFLANQFSEFDLSIQICLKYLSCFNNGATINEISDITSMSVESILKNLKEAEFNGFVVQSNDRYSFSHDKIYEAILSIIDTNEIISINITIGTYLLEQYKTSNYNLFDVLFHLNSVIPKLDLELKRELIGLNYKAAQLAIKSIVYDSALNYVSVAWTLIKEFPNSLYKQKFEIYTCYFECLFYSGNHVVAFDVFKELFLLAENDADKAMVLYIQLKHSQYLNDFQDAITYGFQALQLLNLDILYSPSRWSIYLEKKKLINLMNGRPILELLDLTKLEDSNKRFILQMLMDLVLPAINLCNDKLVAYIALKLVNFSLQHGNSIESAYAYIAYGVIAGTYYNDYSEGYQFGQLGVLLNNKLNDPIWRCRILYTFGASIQCWNEPWQNLTSTFNNAIESGLSSGDFIYAGYACYAPYAWENIYDLSTIIPRIDKYIELARKTGFQSAWKRTILQKQFFKNFAGKTRDRFSFTNEEFNEIDYFTWMKNSNYKMGLVSYYLLKLQIYYTYSNYTGCLNIIDKMILLTVPLAGRLLTIEYYLYSFLTYAKLNKIDAKHHKFMRDAIRKMKVWHDHSPENFSSFYFLMLAELYRIKKKYTKAAQFYIKAIQNLKKNKNIRYEPLAEELMAASFLEVGDKYQFEIHIREAYDLYLRWGSTEKCKHLHELYPDVLGPINSTGIVTNDILVDSAELFSTASLIQSSQIIFNEINLELLCKKMLEIIIKISAVQKGALILIDKNSFIVKVLIDNSSQNNVINYSIPLDTCDLSLSVRLVNFTINTKQLLVMNEFSINESYKNCTYIKHNKPKSVLCLPVMSMVVGKN